MICRIIFGILLTRLIAQANLCPDSATIPILTLVYSGPIREGAKSNLKSNIKNSEEANIDKLKKFFTAQEYSSLSPETVNKLLEFMTQAQPTPSIKGSVGWLEFLIVYSALENDKLMPCQFENKFVNYTGTNCVMEGVIPFQKSKSYFQGGNGYDFRLVGPSIAWSPVKYNSNDSTYSVMVRVDEPGEYYAEVYRSHQHGCGSTYCDLPHSSAADTCPSSRTTDNGNCVQNIARDFDCITLSINVSVVLTKSPDYEWPPAILEDGTKNWQWRRCLSSKCSQYQIR
jgi:hypothetical protein